jgi:hypothetical protein
MKLSQRGSLAGSLAVALALFAGACTQTTRPAAPPPGTIPGVTPSTFRLPEGSGCASDVARFQAVLQNDVDTGNVARSVYDRAEPDLNRASAACSAGRDGEARSILAATKSRFGYR